MKRKFFAGMVLFLCSLLFSFAQGNSKTNIEGLYRKTLDNGMQIFVMENNSAPLAYVEIAVRAGAATQTPENAGLFHLYEHLMFKGNAKYKSQQEFTEAMNRLGVGEWNGTTGVDRVNYFFTVPSSVVRDGMEFWSYAIRTPNIDEGELEREKGVVLSEINGKFTNPAVISSFFFMRKIFPESPWRVDSSGDPKAVQNATIEQMKKIQSEFYVPDNSALFVGGDVKHEEIFKYAEEIFGDWKRSSKKAEFKAPPSKKVSDKVVKLVFADKSMSDNFVSARYALRGPDGETDSGDTYAADVWATLVDEPDGVFKSTFIDNKILSIPDSDYVAAGYYTQRASGLVSFYSYMMNDGNPVEKSDEFVRVIESDLLEKMLDPASGFLNGIKNAERKLEDSRIYQMETATGILSNLSSFFASCGADYFFTYDENISKVTESDVRGFLKKYVEGKNGVLLVTVSPSVFEKYKSDFLNGGFEEVTSDKAFWWR